jgi:hypothetical protein
MQSRPFLQDVVPASRIVEIYEVLRDRPQDLFGTIFTWE